MGKEAGKIGHKMLGMDFILKEIGHLKENRKDLGLFASVLLSLGYSDPLPFFYLDLRRVGGEMGAVTFSVRFMELLIVPALPF